jgi:hypothetical protein
MIRVASLLLFAGFCSGCAELSLFTLASRPDFREATAGNPAIEAVCLWQPAEGRGLDDLPARGFAGQVLFFTTGSNEPVKVEGDVCVYVFDDVGTEEEQARPIHQFNFNTESWNAFLRDANVGPSYQVFVPYTRKGADQAKCAIRIRFTPADGGPVVYSRMDAIELPGRKRAQATPPSAPLVADGVATGSATVSEGSGLNSIEQIAAQLAETADSRTLNISPGEVERFRASLSQLNHAAARSMQSTESGIATVEDAPRMGVDVDVTELADDATTPAGRSYRLMR